MSSPIVMGQPPLGRPGKVNFGWIRESFQYFRQAAGVWVVFTLIWMVAMIVLSLLVSIVAPPPPLGSQIPVGSSPQSNHSLQQLSILLRILGAQSPLHSLLLAVVIIVADAFFMSNGYNLAVMQVQGRTIASDSLFSGSGKMGQMLVFSVIYYAMSLAGCAVFCVGIFFVAGLFMPAGAMIANGVKPIDALSRSVDAMKGDALSAAGFVFVFLLMTTALNLITCGLGEFVTVPMFIIVPALVYRDFIGIRDMDQNKPDVVLRDPPTTAGPKVTLTGDSLDESGDSH